MTGDKLLETIQANASAIPFIARAGLRVLEVRRGYGRAVIPLAGNENHVGSMYMGALATLAEAGAAVSVSTVLDFERFFPVITRLELDFLKPAMSDVSADYSLSEAQISDLLEELEANTRCEYVAEVPMTDEEGLLVARAHVTVKVLSHR